MKSLRMSYLIRRDLGLGRRRSQGQSRTFMQCFPSSSSSSSVDTSLRQGRALQGIRLERMISLDTSVTRNWLGDGSRSISSAMCPIPSNPDSRRLRATNFVSARSEQSCVGSASSSSPFSVSVGEGKDLESDEGSSLQLSNATPFRKKKVAIWIGYVGTAFKGLQILRGPEAANTIEHELERAIYQAGGILDTNYGHLDKVGWSRSSRTDKGVHSLSTVISMKMEIPPSAWMGDPDGLLLADRINVHLPPTIQVFGMVPVTKAFDARRFCCNRTYHYLLPASLIGLSGETSPEAAGEALEEFSSILNVFEGRFAFHNYTIRKLYRADVKSKGSSSARHRDSRPRSLPNKVTAVSASVEDEDEVQVKDEDEPENSEKSSSPDPPAAAAKGPVPIVSDRKKRSASGGDRVMAYWLDTPNLDDKIYASHFRRILECSCGGLESYGGAHFIRISITAESFMLHQIRKMVATAVAVFNGVLPRDIIPISLCRHARIVLPLAPSEGLMLAKNSFYPFRQLHTPERGFRESDVGILRLKELPRLQISKRMSDNVDVFWRDVLLPELAPQLDGSLPLWSTWRENLSQNTILEAEVEKVRASYANWKEESQLKMEAMAQSEATDVLHDPLDELEE